MARKPHRVVGKLLQFTRFSLWDFVLAMGPTTLLIGALCGIAYLLIDPMPPNRLVLNTGQENSAYEQFGKQYQAALAKHGITVTLQRSPGSQDNLQALHRAGGPDVAFVQSGSTAQGGAQDLVSLGSLFTEPVWLFYREAVPLTRIPDLKGMKVNLGPAGSGVPQLFAQILLVNGLSPNELQTSALENTPATMALLDGSIDALVFSSAPDAPLIQMLLQTPGIKLFDFAQAEAYTRRLPFLSHVVLARGVVDLGRDVPSQDYHLIAPTATLVAHGDLHPALVDLLVQAAADIHGGAGWFRKAGEFPTAEFNEIPVAREAAKFYKDGAPFLQRYLPYWLANVIDRMWVFVVAFGALLLPLSRVVPPLYVWRVRSRVYRWYGQLRAAEQTVLAQPPGQRAEVAEQQLARLDTIEAVVNRLTVPLSFADEVYGLRSHIQFVRKRIAQLRDEDSAAPQAPAPA
ncbi:MAG TPA: TAXI family TRAP transporter solute-binding subunit [Burkholderiaceae bacterium]